MLVEDDTSNHISRLVASLEALISASSKRVEKKHEFRTVSAAQATPYSLSFANWERNGRVGPQPNGTTSLLGRSCETVCTKRNFDPFGETNPILDSLEARDRAQAPASAGLSGKSGCEVVGGAYPSSDASLQITELSTSRSPLCGWPATMSALRQRPPLAHLSRTAKKARPAGRFFVSASCAACGGG
jgi:hypothetical protein